MRPSYRARVGVGVLLATVASMGIAPPALAVGPQSLDDLIIDNPLPGSVPLSTATLDAAVNSLHGVEQVASQGNATASIATEGWHAPTSSGLFLLITLVEVKGKTRTAGQLTSLAAQLASSATQSFCSASSSTAPFINKPAPDVPHATYVICGTSSTDTNAEAIIVAKGNLTEIVATTVQTQSPAAFQSIARQQYDVLPARAPSTAKPADPKKPWTLRQTLGVAAAAGSACVAIVVVSMVLRDRRRQRRGWA
jgi:hypothetical protein